MIGFGIARLGFSPDALWRATPREIALAADCLAGGRGRGPGTPDRDALGRLMARFPDA